MNYYPHKLPKYLIVSYLLSQEVEVCSWGKMKDIMKLQCIHLYDSSTLLFFNFLHSVYFFMAEVLFTSLIFVSEKGVGHIVTNFSPTNITENKIVYGGEIHARIVVCAILWYVRHA